MPTYTDSQLATFVRERNGEIGVNEDFIVQLTQQDPDLDTVDETFLITAGINKAKTLYWSALGEKFDADGVDADLLAWQVEQLCDLAVWALQAKKQRESVYNDARYKRWKEEVLYERERNRMVQPIGDTTVTDKQPQIPTPPVYPVMNDNNFDSLVPGNNNSGGVRGGRDGVGGG